MYEESLYEHNLRMKKLLKLKSILEDRYKTCDNAICKSNLECLNCKIYNYNKKIKERIRRLGV